MRKRNKENAGLPSRWRYYHGAFRYQVPPGQEQAWDGKKQFTLGKTLSAAYATWAERVGNLDRVTTVSELLDQYARDVIPKKSKRTQKGDLPKLPILRKRFGKSVM